MTPLILAGGATFVSKPFHASGAFYIQATGLGLGNLVLEIVSVKEIGRQSGDSACGNGASLVCNPEPNCATVVVIDSLLYPDFVLCRFSPLGAVPVGGWYRVVLSSDTPLATASVGYEQISIEQAIPLLKLGGCAYCPSLLLSASCNKCGEQGYAYRLGDNRDPKATVAVLDCLGATAAYVYPTPSAGITVEYTGGTSTVIGYLANSSKCAPATNEAAVINVNVPPAQVTVNNISGAVDKFPVALKVDPDGMTTMTMNDGSQVISNAPTAPIC